MLDFYSQLSTLSSQLNAVQNGGVIDVDGLYVGPKRLGRFSSFAHRNSITNSSTEFVPANDLVRGGLRFTRQIGERQWDEQLQPASNQRWMTLAQRYSTYYFGHSHRIALVSSTLKVILFAD